MCCMQQCFRLLIQPHIVRKNTYDVACVDTQRSEDHNSSYKPTKIGIVTGGGGSMETAAVSSLHDAAIGIVTQHKGKHL